MLKINKNNLGHILHNVEQQKKNIDEQLKEINQKICKFSIPAIHNCQTIIEQGPYIENLEINNTLLEIMKQQKKIMTRRYMIENLLSAIINTIDNSNRYDKLLDNINRMNSKENKSHGECIELENSKLELVNLKKNILENMKYIMMNYH